MATPRRFTGNVVKKQLNPGSKSDHMAVVLESGGASLKLRREGGNPFFDAELEKLVGKTIEARGTLLDSSTVLMSSWQELDEPGA
jgi:hypothetical protein